MTLLDSRSPRPSGEKSAIQKSPMGEFSKPAERIIEAARTLFCREGIHATGIDRILEEAGAAKMTLYNQFGSKEGLVDVVLRREGEAWRGWFRDALDQSGNTPREKLENLFAVLRQWFARADYSGCAFMNAVAEYPKGDKHIQALALEHKREVGAILRGLVVESGVTDSGPLLEELTILFDGAIIAALIGGDPKAADSADRVARVLLAARLS